MSEFCKFIRIIPCVLCKRQPIQQEGSEFDRKKSKEGRFQQKNTSKSGKFFHRNLQKFADIIEVGGGNGTLAQGILDKMKTIRYYSPFHVSHFATPLSEIKWAGQTQELLHFFLHKTCSMLVLCNVGPPGSNSRAHRLGLVFLIWFIFNQVNPTFRHDFRWPWRGPMGLVFFRKM